MHRHCPLGGHGGSARHPCDQRRVGCVHAFADAVHGADRRGSRRPDRRPARDQPDVAGDRRELRARSDRRRHEGRPDDGRGRRKPGARGQTPRSARSRAHRDQEALRRAGGASFQGRQGQVALPGAHSDARRALRRRDRLAHRRTGNPRKRCGSRGDRREGVRRADDDLDRGRRDEGASDAHVAEHDRREAPQRCGREARPRAVRHRAARPHRRRAGLEGAEEREAAPALRADHRDGQPAVPGWAGQLRRRGRQGFRDEELRQEGGRSGLQRPRPQEDRDRQAPPRRQKRRADPRDRLRGDGQPAYARVGPVHPRPDADHVALHARHRQGGAAHRRSVARRRAPLHAPLQLPAVLGRGDGHASRPEAARHRSRCARAAGARGGDSAGRPTSRTRSASSRKRSSRTARRRWARCAARRLR